MQGLIFFTSQRILTNNWEISLLVLSAAHPRGRRKTESQARKKQTSCGKMSEPQKRTDRYAARGEFSNAFTNTQAFSNFTSTMGKHVYRTPQMKCPQILHLFPCNSQWLKAEDTLKRHFLRPQKTSVVWRAWECPESQTMLAVIELHSFLMASLRLSDLKHEGRMCYRGLEGSKHLILLEEETAANHQTPLTAFFSLFPSPTLFIPHQIRNCISCDNNESLSSNEFSFFVNLAFAFILVSFFLIAN